AWPPIMADPPPGPKRGDGAASSGARYRPGTPGGRDSDDLRRRPIQTALLPATTRPPPKATNGPGANPVIARIPTGAGVGGGALGAGGGGPGAAIGEGIGALANESAMRPRWSKSSTLPTLSTQASGSAQSRLVPLTVMTRTTR